MRPLLAVPLMVLLGALGLWWWLGADAGGGQVAGTPGSSGPDLAPDAGLASVDPALLGGGSAAAVETREALSPEGGRAGGGGPVQQPEPSRVRLTGVVLDPAGHPVEGATVLERVPAPPQELNEGEPLAQTDDQGRYRADLGNGTHRVFARAEGWAASLEAAVTLGAGERREDLVLVLQAGARVAGLLLDGEGTPVPRARVLAITLQTTELRSTRTDDHGAFLFEAVTPGSWMLQATPGLGDEPDPRDAISAMVVATVDVADGEEVHVVLGGEERGQVRVHGTVSHSGGPLPANLTFLPDGGGGLGSVRLARGDGDGSYEVELPHAGGWYVFFEPLEGPLMMPVTLRIEVPEVASHRADLVLPLGTLSGRVLGPQGDPASLLVDLQREGGTAGRMPEATGMQRTVFSGPDGRYSTLLPAGTWTVGVGGKMLSGLQVVAGEELSDVDFHLDAEGSLRGLVLDAQGRPAAGASVWLRDRAGRTLSLYTPTRTDASGRFEVERLQPMAYSALARLEGQVSDAGVLFEVRSGEPTSVELKLEPGGFLNVRLSPADAADPLGVTRLEATDDRGHRVDGLAGPDLLEDLLSEGLSSTEVRLGPLAPGGFLLRARADDGRRAQTRVALEPGRDELDVELVLRP